MTDVNICEVLKMVNDEDLKVKDVAEKYGVSAKTIARKMLAKGYKFDRKEGMYLKVKEVQEVEKVQEVELVPRSFVIPEDVDGALSAKALKERVDKKDIVAEALRQYIEQKYFDFIND